MPRKYQAIWETVKSRANLPSPNNICTVEVHDLLHPRIKKAVIKEKHLDLGFKVMNTHDHFVLVTEAEVDKKDRSKSKLRFYLKQSLGLEGVKGNESDEDIQSSKRQSNDRKVVPA